MVKNRIIFALWLLLWLATWAQGKGNMAACILIGTVVCAVMEIIIAFMLRKKLTAELSAGISCRKGEELLVTVTVRNSGIFSCLRVQAVVRCRDLLTGEETRATALFPVSGKSEAQAVCDFRPPRCGKLALTLSELRVFDLFGLVGAKKTVALSAPSLVLPDIWPVELSVSERQSPDMDSDEYSMYHPGDDPSETFALREYLSGDRIKNIHWKLSEKTDHLMVRQLGLPVNNSILLVLDNSAGTAPSAAEREALGEAVVSVSAALCEAGLPHQAAWLDRETMEPQLCAIGSMEELTQALSGLLSAETEPDEQTVTQRLAEEQGLDYAHVVALSLRPEEEELYTASGTPVAHLTVSENVLKSKEGIYLAL